MIFNFTELKNSFCIFHSSQTIAVMEFLVLVITCSDYDNYYKHDSQFMMAWLDDQLEMCCPLLVSQLMLSYRVEDLNCFWRSKMIKMLSIILSTMYLLHC